MTTDYADLLENKEWPIVRIRFEFETKDSVRLSAYAGSMIRGVFGHSLRRICCMTKQKQCLGCPLHETCAYAKIFEPKALALSSFHPLSNRPVPYVFEPLWWGERILTKGENISFDMVLFGESVPLLSLIIFALEKGFLRGIGHGKAQLKNVYQVKGRECIPIFTQGAAEISAFEKTVRLSKTYSSCCRLTISTPLRIQKEGKILNSFEWNPVDFFNALARRIGLISEFQLLSLELPYQKILKEASTIGFEKNLACRNWVRYSNRQRSLMTLSGSVGEVHMSGLSRGLFRLLELAEFFHVGKNSSFGLGKIQIS